MFRCICPACTLLGSRSLAFAFLNSSRSSRGNSLHGRLSLEGTVDFGRNLVNPIAVFGKEPDRGEDSGCQRTFLRSSSFGVRELGRRVFTGRGGKANGYFVDLK